MKCLIIFTLLLCNSCVTTVDLTQEQKEERFVKLCTYACNNEVESVNPVYGECVCIHEPNTEINIYPECPLTEEK